MTPITISKCSNGGYFVSQGDKVADRLCLDEALGVVAHALFGDGSASVINGDQQTIVVEALDEAETTYCTATNDEGSYRARAGEGMRVYRSSDDLVVKCENLEQQATTVIESRNEWFYYIIDFGLVDLCLISCWVDTGTGNIYEYPQRTSLLMDYKSTERR